MVPVYPCRHLSAALTLEIQFHEVRYKDPSGRGEGKALVKLGHHLGKMASYMTSKPNSKLTVVQSGFF